MTIANDINTVRKALPAGIYTDEDRAARAALDRLADTQHWTRRMLQALDIYWLHYDGLPSRKIDSVRSESTDEDWWFRFEKYRKRVEEGLR